MRLAGPVPRGKEEVPFELPCDYEPPTEPIDNSKRRKVEFRGVPTTVAIVPVGEGRGDPHPMSAHFIPLSPWTRNPIDTREGGVVSVVDEGTTAPEGTPDMWFLTFATITDRPCAKWRLRGFLGVLGTVATVVEDIAPQTPIYEDLPIVFTPIYAIFFAKIIVVRTSKIRYFFPRTFRLPFPRFPRMHFQTFLSHSFHRSSRKSSRRRYSFFFASSLLLILFASL